MQNNVAVEKTSGANLHQDLFFLLTADFPASDPSVVIMPTRSADCINQTASILTKVVQTMATLASAHSESMSLLMNYFQQPSVKVRNQLVLLNAGLVRQIAHRIGRQCAEPYQDLEQIGYLGLIRAIERFNPHQGCAFSSFAVPYIRGEVLHFLRDKSSVLKIPRRWQELQKEGEKVRQQLTAKLGRKVRDEEIAVVLNVSVNEWRETQAAEHNRQALSLDATVGQMLDCPVTLGDSLPDSREQQRQYLEEERQQLEGAISELESKTKQAIEFVYIKGLPRKEAAKRIGVSPMTVTRHLQRGVKQLSTLLRSEEALMS